MKVLIATSNTGKLRDFVLAAAAWPGVLIAPLPGLFGIPAPAEEEATFTGNARVKALFYSAFAPGEIVIADDSGLEVDALGGLPGVRSARYADDRGFPPGGSADERNNLCLLQALGGRRDRAARYRCVLAAAREGAILQVAEGAAEGEILFAPRGNGGFGYDSLFLVPAYGRSMAEVEPAERLAYSHRGAAFRALLPLLLGHMNKIAQALR